MAVQLPALPEGNRYYLLRDNVMVPLVPADQIPLQLRELPRQLTHRQMSDENWKLLLETNHPATLFTVKKFENISQSPPTPKSSPPFLAPDHDVRNSSKDLIGPMAEGRRWPPSPLPVHTAETNVHASPTITTQQPSSLTDTFASIYRKDAQRVGYHTPNPSGIEPDQSKKVYCSHWIRTGECGWMAVGCRYKHEMPSIAKLRELGFMQVPRWWKEKSSIMARGQTWMQRRLAAGQDDGAQVADPEMPPPRAFPDPSTFRNKSEAASNFDDQKEHGPTNLQQNVDVEQEAAHPRAVRESPLEATPTRQSVTTDNLIDLDDAPVPCCSAQRAARSLIDAGSSDAHSVSGSSSTSSAHMFLLDGLMPMSTQGVERYQHADEVPKDKTILRRSSKQHKDTDAEKSHTPAKSIIKDTNTPRKISRRSDAPLKQAGLAESKHAVANNEMPRPTDAGSKNSNRKPVEVVQTKTDTREKPTHTDLKHAIATDNVPEPADASKGRTQRPTRPFQSKMNTDDKSKQSRNSTRGKGRSTKRTSGEPHAPSTTAKRLSG